MCGLLGKEGSWGGCSTKRNVAPGRSPGLPSTDH